MYEFKLHKGDGAELGIEITTWLASDGNHSENSPFPYFFVAVVSADGRMAGLEKDLKLFSTMYQSKMTGSPLVLVNYGLRFNRHEDSTRDYEEEFKLFLSVVDNGISALNGTIIYRETSAQHFDSPTGEFTADSTKDGRGCAKCNITESNYQQYNWKNKVVDRIISSTSTRFTHRFITAPFF